MNILTDNLPTELVICGENCPIRSDFRTFIKVSETVLGSEWSIEKTLDLIKLVFINVPPNLYEAIRAVMWFLSPPREQENGEKTDEAARKRVFDYEVDSYYIYSAFMQQYGIDLCSAELHWWQFKALFDGLTEDTQFIKIVQIRSMDLNDIKDKDMKKRYRKMKALYKLPDNRTQEQKEEDFNNSIAALF